MTYHTYSAGGGAPPTGHTRLKRVRRQCGLTLGLFEARFFPSRLGTSRRYLWRCKREGCDVVGTALVSECVCATNARALAYARCGVMCQVANVSVRE